MAGVGRLGHGLVREIYALNDQLEVMGLRNLVRQTSTGRPHDMPLTEDWLVDFSRFFAIGSSVPQTGAGAGAACRAALRHRAGGGLGRIRRWSRPARSGCLFARWAALGAIADLPGRPGGAAPVRGVLRAGREPRGRGALADWLADTGLAPAEIDRLAADPPLTLFLMLEAEADTGGRTLGALGSVIMGETIDRGAAGGRGRPRARRPPAPRCSATGARHDGRR